MTGYVRKDTTNNIADGNVINAADLDAEFDGVKDAFQASTGHKHDGTTGEGAPITSLGPNQDVTISATLLAPKTTNTVDIGSSALKFKDLFLAGNGSVGGTLAVTGVATFSAGSAAAPAITTTGDTNTGMFFPAADTIAFAEGGAEIARFDSSGNLGLGVTPSAWGNGYKAFQIGQSSFSGVGNAVYLWQNIYQDSGGTNRYISTGTAGFVGWEGNTYKWYQAPSGTAGNAITSTQAMTLDASGNLGVGTTSPSARLDVNAGTATSGNMAVFRNSDGTYDLALTISRSLSGITLTNSNIATGSANNLIFANSTAGETARIDSSGNLLVGATSQISAEKFGVTANVASYMAIFKNSGNNANRLGIAIQCGANDASGTNFAMAFDDGDGTRQGQITFSGGTTTYGTSSDYRLKENVQPINNAIERLSLLKPCKWNWKRDGGESEGFIAHELQDIVPIAVAGEKDAMDENGKPIYQSVGAANIVPLLTKALQEALAEINQLKARLDAANL